MADVGTAPDVQPVAGRGDLYVGGPRVADDSRSPRGELPSERVQTVVQVQTDNVVVLGENEAQTHAGRRRDGFSVRAPGPRTRR